MTLDVLEEVKAIGAEVILQGDNMVIRPASRVPAELKTRLKRMKPAIVEALKKSNSSTGLIPTEPCRACGSRLFWRSVHGVTICWCCHPGSESMVRDILYLERRAGVWTCEPKVRIN